MNLTGDELATLDRVARSPDGQQLIALLQRRLAEHDAECRHADGNEIYRAQGRAQDLELLLDDLKGAGQRLKSLGHR